MTLKSDLSAYQEHWNAVEEFLTEERRLAQVELRWRQLNAAYGMVKALGLLKPDPSELGVFARWAKLKEKALSQPPKP